MKCFYHRADLDGKCSGAIVKKFRPDCEMIGIDYGEELPLDSIAYEETVYVVDFSFSAGEMLELKEKAHLIWIDHHKTAIDHLSKFTVEGIQRVGLGACALVWEYFHESPVPWAVRLLAEYDVWKHDDPDVLPFQYAVRNIQNDPEAPYWRELLSGDQEAVRELIQQGALLLDYERKQNAIQASAKAFWTELDGLKILAANHGPGNSKFFESITERPEADAVCLFYWRQSRKKWTVSLYTDNRTDVDVSVVCKARGGGGHKGAAGFMCDELPFKLGGR